MIDIKVLKANLVEYVGEDTTQIKRFVGYVDSINKMQWSKKDNKDIDMSFGMKIEDFVKIFIKYNNVGITVDGVNAVVTGYNKVFITWVGYKNKVLSVYPESEFDTQLVRTGDTTSFAKESGSVIYTHTIADPFSSNVGIIGSYCVIKNKRGEFLETLGLDDFNKMKESAMMKSTWDKWESEFWLKSVIKRACKRHFNDVVEEIEKIDNEDYSHEETLIEEPKRTTWTPNANRPMSEQQKMFLDNALDSQNVTDKNAWMYDNYGFNYDDINEEQAQAVLDDFRSEYKAGQKILQEEANEKNKNSKVRLN